MPRRLTSQEKRWGFSHLFTVSCHFLLSLTSVSLLVLWMCLVISFSNQHIFFKWYWLYWLTFFFFFKLFLIHLPNWVHLGSTHRSLRLDDLQGLFMDLPSIFACVFSTGTVWLYTVCVTEDLASTVFFYSYIPDCIFLKNCLFPYDC